MQIKIKKVSIVKGNDRKRNILKALELIKIDIEKAIEKKNTDTLFIKINAIDTGCRGASTSLGAIESVLDFFNKNFKNKFKKIIVGDNTFVFTKFKGGPYRKLLEKYNIILSDLTEFPSQEIKFKQLNKKVVKTRISRLPQIAFTVSLALPKTHDEFVYTGCLKNMFGCVLGKREALHSISFLQRILIDKYVKANKIKRENLANVIKSAPADLNVLDGFTGMQDEGPLLGKPVELKIALASLDGFALDRIASRLIGFEKVPYLPQKEKMKEGKFKILKSGFKELSEISRKFKPHYKMKYQLMDNWKGLPKIDYRFVLSVLRRFYRIKDKLIEKLREKVKS